MDGRLYVLIFTLNINHGSSSVLLKNGNSTCRIFLEGGLGALERALPEAGHLRHGGRYFCLDPVRRTLVRGAGERQRSSGRRFSCFHPQHVSEAVTLR